jgi:hypothetical protein
LRVGTIDTNENGSIYLLDGLDLLNRFYINEGKWIHRASGYATSLQYPITQQCEARKAAYSSSPISEARICNSKYCTAAS